MEATVWLEPLLHNPDCYIPCCSMVRKSRLVLMLIRDSVCAEERHELFSHMWRWLALGVLRLGWRQRLVHLMGQIAQGFLFPDVDNVSFIHIFEKP